MGALTPYYYTNMKKIHVSGGTPTSGTKGQYNTNLLSDDTANGGGDPGGLMESGADQQASGTTGDYWNSLIAGLEYTGDRPEWWQTGRDENNKGWTDERNRELDKKAWEMYLKAKEQGVDPLTWNFPGAPPDMISRMKAIAAYLDGLGSRSTLPTMDPPEDADSVDTTPPDYNDTPNHDWNDKAQQGKAGVAGGLAAVAKNFQTTYSNPAKTAVNPVAAPVAGGSPSGRRGAGSNGLSLTSLLQQPPKRRKKGPGDLWFNM